MSRCSSCRLLPWIRNRSFEIEDPCDLFIRTALQASRGVSGLPCRVITRTAPRIAITVRLALMKAKLERSHDSAPKNDVVPYRVLHNFGVVSQLQVLHNAVFVKGDCPRR